MATVGEDILAEDLNAISQKPVVRLIQAAAQSLANASNVAVTFAAGSEDIDTDGFHDTTTNTSRITPTVAGYYRLTGTLWMSAATFNDVSLQVSIGKNGSVTAPTKRLRYQSATSTARCISVEAVLQADGISDYFELIGNQSTGGALNTQTGGSTASVLECVLERLA